MKWHAALTTKKFKVQTLRVGMCGVKSFQVTVATTQVDCKRCLKMIERGFKIEVVK